MTDAHVPSSEEAQLVAALTQREMSVLRLSLCGLTSKEISRIWGKSHHTIDKDAERACELLSVKVKGTKRRPAGGRIVMRHFIGPYERLVYEALPLATISRSAAFPDRSDDEDMVERDGVAETRTAYIPPPALLSMADKVRRDVTPDRLRPWLRLWVLVPVAALILLSVTFALLSAGREASDWARQTFPNHPANR